MAGDAPTDPPRAGWRDVPIDLIALFAIALAIVVSHFSYLRHGMCWNEPSALYHFGHRVAGGDTPYADFVFHGGPLPVYVDAALQEVRGGIYRGSLDAALAIKILRVFVMWMLARRLAGVPAAAALAVFCALDPVFAYAHHASTAYVQLFVTLGGLLLVLASRAEGPRERGYLAAAGFAVALVAWARPALGLMLGGVALALTAILLRRGEYFTRRRFAVLWGGYAAGLALLVAVLAAAGALGPAIEQTLLDPSPEEAFGLESAHAAWLGGAAVDRDLPGWAAVLASFALPAAVVAGIVYLLARGREVTPQAVAALGIGAGVAFGIQTRPVSQAMYGDLIPDRYASLDAFSDLPRLLLLAVVVIAVASPERARRWLGLAPIAVIALAALPLLADRSYPGAAWSETSIHAIGGVLVVLATARISDRTKTAVCIALALAAGTHFLLVRRYHHPFAHPKATDGSIGKNRYSVVVNGRRHPLLRGLKVNQARATAYEWLATQIAPGSTCFIHGDLPALYTLLGCENPTRVDTTAASLITGGDAAAAAAALRAAPPAYVLVHERQRLAELALELGRYEPVATIREAIGEELATQAAAQWDAIDAVRLYRRKDGP